MKKIIFSLLAVALMVTSCDKDAVDGGDYSSINVAQEAAEIDATVDYDYLGFLDGLADAAPAPTKTVKGPSTARTGVAGTEWLHAIFFTLGTNELVYLSADTDPESCIPSTGVHAQASGAISVLYTFREVGGNGLLQVQIGDGAVVNRGVSNLVGYRNLFGANLGYVRKSNAQRSGTIAGVTPPASAFDFSCADEVFEWGESPTVPGLFIHATLGSYQTAPAPFPLVGMLATVVTQESGVTGTLNYAASTVGAVRDAIEGAAAGGFGDGN